MRLSPYFPISLYTCIPVYQYTCFPMRLSPYEPVFIAPYAHALLPPCPLTLSFISTCLFPHASHMHPIGISLSLCPFYSNTIRAIIVAATAKYFPHTQPSHYGTFIAIIYRINSLLSPNFPSSCFKIYNYNQTNWLFSLIFSYASLLL